MFLNRIFIPSVSLKTGGISDKHGVGELSQFLGTIIFVLPIGLLSYSSVTFLWLEHILNLHRLFYY